MADDTAETPTIHDRVTEIEAKFEWLLEHLGVKHPSAAQPPEMPAATPADAPTA